MCDPGLWRIPMFTTGPGSVPSPGESLHALGCLHTGSAGPQAGKGHGQSPHTPWSLAEGVLPVRAAGTAGLPPAAGQTSIRDFAHVKKAVMQTTAKWHIGSFSSFVKGKII